MFGKVLKEAPPSRPENFHRRHSQPVSSKDGKRKLHTSPRAAETGVWWKLLFGRNTKGAERLTRECLYCRWMGNFRKGRFVKSKKAGGMSHQIFAVFSVWKIKAKTAVCFFENCCIRGHGFFANGVRILIGTIVVKKTQMGGEMPLIFLW